MRLLPNPTLTFPYKKKGLAKEKELPFLFPIDKVAAVDAGHSLP